MATQPTPAPKPAQPHQQAPHPKPAEDPHPAKREPHAPPLPIGAKPDDPKDPQAAKFEAHAGPPSWNDPKHSDTQPPTVYTPEPSLDPRAHAPQGAYADGMDIATEQRARAAYVEAHGAPPDERPEAERPVYDPHALSGGGAFVSAGKQSKVPGVAPPAKRE